MTILSLTKHKLALLLIVNVSLLVTACSGGSEQQDGQLLSPGANQSPAQNQPPTSDQTPQDNTLTTVNGLVMNGYLANALVWVDLKNNATIDGFEPFAYTDSHGYFSYNPVLGQNYCTSGQTEHKRFCLQTSLAEGDIIVRATKGVELLSGESFKGLITSKVNIAQMLEQFDTLSSLGAKPQGDTNIWRQNVAANLAKISPLSSLAYHLPENTSLAAALTSIGFSNASFEDADLLINSDYIADLTDDELSTNELFVAASTISGMVDIISSNLDEAASSAGSNVDLGIDGLPISSADAVYEALADVLSDDVSSSSTSSTSSINIASNKSQTQSNVISNALLNRAADKFGNKVAALNDNSQALVSQLNQLKDNLLIVEQASGIANIANLHFYENNNIQAGNTHALLLGVNLSLNLVTTNDTIAFQSSNKAAAVIALVEYLAAPQNPISVAFTEESEQALNAQDDGDDSLDQNVDLFSFNDSLIDTIEDDGDLDSLIQDNVVPTELEDIDDSNGSIWLNRALSLSGIQDQNEQGQVIAFFDGNGTSNTSTNSGELIMCVAYINPKDPKDNITGALFEGTWSVIGNKQNRLSLVAEGFTVQMKVLGESFGRDIPSEQQLANLQRLPSDSYGKFSFTLNQDSAIWHSDDSSVNQSYGLIDYTDLPQNNADCQNILRL